MQEHWRAAQQGGEADGAPPADSALLLRVIATSAARFPPAEAASLAKDLLKARRLRSCLPSCWCM